VRRVRERPYRKIREKRLKGKPFYATDPSAVTVIAAIMLIATSFPDPGCVANPQDQPARQRSFWKRPVHRSSL